MSARNLNPKQIALEGVNWGEYRGEHPLGFPRGEQYTPDSFNKNHIPKRTPTDATAYHVSHSPTAIASIAEGGVRQSTYSKRPQRNGVYAMPEGSPVAVQYGDARAPVFQIRADASEHLSDPDDYHAGSTRIPRDVPPEDVRLVGHLAGGFNSGSRLHSRFTVPNYIHWGTMHPDDCESCNLTNHYEEDMRGTPTAERLAERDGYYNLRALPHRSTEPQQNEVLAGFHDLPHNEDLPQEYELHARRLEQFRKGK